MAREDEMANNDVNAILFEEYRVLWNYYICQINTLSGFRQLYIKIFLVPASVLITAALVFSELLAKYTAISTDIIFLSIFVLLFIAFLMGMSLFISYYKELGNLGNYEQAMIDIRDHFRAKDDLAGVLTVDKYRRMAPIAKLVAKDKKRGFYRSLLFSLGLIFIVGNSFLAAMMMVSLFASTKMSYYNLD